MIQVRAALDSDARSLVSRLRVADLQEIRAVTPEEPCSVLRQSIAWSNPCYTIVEADAESLAIFGVVPDASTEGVGRVWLLGSDDLFLSHSYIFLRRSRKWIEKLHEHYPTLWNYVDVRNEVHIRWLKWCGFTFLRRIEEYGVEQRPFYEFEKITGITPTPPRTSDG